MTFKSRRDGVNITALVAESKVNRNNPWVILTHGRGMCVSVYNTALPANMLWRAGYNVMLVNLRNHYVSGFDADGLLKWGLAEANDVLAAWDWVRAVPNGGVRAENIGMFGPSFGGATMTTAAGRNPLIRATFVDSPVCDPFKICTQGVEDFSNGGLKPLAAELCKAAYDIYRMLHIKTGYDLRAPAANELIKNLRANQWWMAVTTLGDKSVPPSHAEECYGNAMGSLAGNASKVLLLEYDDIALNNTRNHIGNAYTKQYEDSHTETMLYAPKLYEAALLQFFGNALEGPLQKPAGWAPHARLLSQMLAAHPIPVSHPHFEALHASARAGATL